jgi:hypothetical protein
MRQRRAGPQAATEFFDLGLALAEMRLPVRHVLLSWDRQYEPHIASRQYVVITVLLLPPGIIPRRCVLQAGVEPNRLPRGRHGCLLEPLPLQREALGASFAQRLN